MWFYVLTPVNKLPWAWEYRWLPLILLPLTCTWKWGRLKTSQFYFELGGTFLFLSITAVFIYVSQTEKGSPSLPPSEQSVISACRHSDRGKMLHPWDAACISLRTDDFGHFFISLLYSVSFWKGSLLFCLFLHWIVYCLTYLSLSYIFIINSIRHIIQRYYLSICICLFYGSLPWLFIQKLLVLRKSHLPI